MSFQNIFFRELLGKIHFKYRNVRVYEHKPKIEIFPMSCPIDLVIALLFD